MTCKPTNIPARGELDIPALKEKYRQEKDKRLRKDGQKQFIDAGHDFTNTYKIDPHTPVTPRDSIAEDLDALVIGGGWSGLLAGANLRKAGIDNFRVIDHAGDFGGVWYWNRYPGVQCDNDAYCYLPLLEEMGHMPKQKFENGQDIREYAQSIGRRFDLYNGALFHTTVDSIQWDESIQRIRVKTDRGDELRARFVIMANGMLNIPKLPGVPGINTFKGKMFHTARWDYEYTGGTQENPVLDKLADKRVAIVGTGATAIQAIPYLGKYAKQLYILQRTPSSVDARSNPPTDPEWVKSLEPGWQAARQDNFHRAVMEGMFRPGEDDLICDFWTEMARNMTAELEAEGWPQLTPEEFGARLLEMDYRVMERMRRHVEESVDDKETAEALKPWFRFPCKRPLSNNEYYPTINKPHVKLIDVSATKGVEAMTEKGFVADGVEYEIDCMIFASGYEVTSDLDRRWGIETVAGRDGQTIYDAWDKDGYQTLHGVMSHGFPNQFFIGLYQGGLNASVPENYNAQSRHIAYIIKQTMDRGCASVEPTKEAQDAYVKHIRDTAIDISELQSECTPTYLNNEGEVSTDSEGKQRSRWYLGETYGPGWNAFQEMMQAWRDKGDMEGLELK